MTVTTKTLTVLDQIDAALADSAAPPSPTVTDDPYTTTPTHLRVFEVDTEWSLDAADDAGRYTEECWTFPTREEAEAARPRFVAVLAAAGVTLAPRWRVEKLRDPAEPRTPWKVSRSPVPELDPRVPLGADDERAAIDGGEHRTWEDAQRAANAGAALDREAAAMGYGVECADCGTAGVVPGTRYCLSCADPHRPEVEHAPRPSCSDLCVTHPDGPPALPVDG